MGISSHNNTGLLLLLLLLLLFSVLVSKSSCKTSALDLLDDYSYEKRKTTVDIQNDIESNGAYLYYHCWSRDDDLGQRSLNQGEQWYWEFRPYPTTHFWCEFRWYDNWDYHWKNGTFTVYRGGFFRDKYAKDLCGKDCSYSARRDGLYLLTKDYVWVKREE
ncbi:hypothetical protein MKW94_004294 [Papaver nudicaule]|uniref:S-protein homolog n=1 Tax=Papaver nudicaule TaxID=74823 RepID=A0AA41VV89_PAPNU|nr:hypothetical protein [Papaver nudicaule]